MYYSARVMFVLIIILKVNAGYASDIRRIEAMQQSIEEAENNADLNLLKKLFTDDAVYLFTEGPPIVGDHVIQSMYEFVLNRNKWTSSYQNNVTDIKENSATMRGVYTYKLTPKNGGDIQEDRVPYEWLFIKRREGWKLAQLIYGDKVELQSRVPDLPEPTGKYAVGIRDFYFTDPDRLEVFTEDKSDSREVAFQIWYPAQNVRGEIPRPYQNLAMTKAAANFLNWPLFANSYNVFVKSNSFSNAAAKVSSRLYPVILYNHGYSGFTTVHQTIYEELASHGFVVVSVGHAYESAFLLKPDGNVITFDPENKAYRARLAEAGGNEQERLKDQIIYADNLNDMENSYRQLLEKSPLHQQSIQIWAADNRFVLKKLEQIYASDSILQGIFDFENVGIVGHSLGGATAGELALIEPKIKAGINLDGFQFGGLLATELRIPFMFIWENGQNNIETGNGNDLFFQKSRAACYSLLIKGFEHATFTDLPLFETIWESPEPNPQGLHAIKLQREYILAFFNKHLKDLPASLLNGPSQKYPEVIFNIK